MASSAPARSGYTGPGQVVALMLAAGRGRRFGADKRLVRLAGSETLMAAACVPVLSIGLPLYVAVRPEDDLDALCGSAAGAVRRLDIRTADRGMGATLAEAVAALPIGTAGCLVLLADMPLLRQATLRQLAAALGEAGADGLVAPTWQGRRGHPVGFGRRWFAELMQLDGDRGGRDVLAAAEDDLQLVPVDDPAVLADIDTVGDLIRLQSPGGQ